MTPEARVKKQVVSILKRHGAYYFYPVTGGYGRSGVPDIVACWQGRFIGIECKAGDNVLTPLQEKNLQEIRMNRGIAMVITEKDIPWLMTAMQNNTLF